MVIYTTWIKRELYLFDDESTTCKYDPILDRTYFGNRLVIWKYSNKKVIVFYKSNAKTHTSLKSSWFGFKKLTDTEINEVVRFELLTVIDLIEFFRDSAGSYVTFMREHFPDLVVTL